MTTSLNDLMSSPPADPDDTVVAPDPPETDEEEDDDLFDEDALTAAPRTSRLTLTLVALLILVVGFLAGVEVQQLLGVASGG